MPLARSVAIAALASLPALAPLAHAANDYPPTRVEVVEETFHGETIPDPYRWLEPLESESAEVEAWTTSQNDFTRGVLEGLACRAALERELRPLLEIGAVGMPRERSGRLFWTQRDGDQDQPVLRVARSRRRGAGAPRSEGPRCERPRLDGLVQPESRRHDRRGGPLAGRRRDAGAASHEGRRRHLPRRRDRGEGELALVVPRRPTLRLRPALRPERRLLAAVPRARDRPQRAPRSDPREAARAEPRALRGDLRRWALVRDGREPRLAGERPRGRRRDRVGVDRHDRSRGDRRRPRRTLLARRDRRRHDVRADDLRGAERPPARDRSQPAFARRRAGDRPAARAGGARRRLARPRRARRFLERGRGEFDRALRPRGQPARRGRPAGPRFGVDRHQSGSRERIRLVHELQPSAHDLPLRLRQGRGARDVGLAAGAGRSR